MHEMHANENCVDEWFNRLDWEGKIADQKNETG